MPVDAELLESPAFPGLLARLKARAAQFQRDQVRRPPLVHSRRGTRPRLLPSLPFHSRRGNP